MFHHFFGPNPTMQWYGWIPFIIGNLFWIVLLGLLIGLGIRLLQSPQRTPISQPQIPPTSALDILQMRYARGEIDAETFEQMRQRILGIGNNPPPTQV